MNKENEELALAEVYRLTLEHYINVNGQHVEIDEPIVVQMVFDRQFAPTSICLNSMLDKMRVEALQKVGREPATLYADNVKILELMSQEE